MRIGLHPVMPAAAFLPQVPFYRGKTITVTAGQEPGGLGDLRLKSVLPYFKKHIPGQPNIVTEGGPMKAHFLMLARYNAWANVRLYKMAGALPEELYRREVGVYFKSLHGTLNHLLVTDRIWMRRLTGEGSHPNKLNAIAFDDFASLQAARMSEDLRIVDYIERLQEADIEKELDYSTLNGTPQRQPICEILAHWFNHQTHHRGQAHAALTLVGVTEPTPLDLLAMQRSAAGRSAAQKMPSERTSN